MKYYDEIIRGMNLLNSDPKTIFLGQSVVWKGNGLYGQVKDFPVEKRVECPIGEEWQMGHSLGLALDGWKPVSMYPRFNFTLLSLGQLVLAVDKMFHIARGEINPKVIVKVICGSSYPLNPQKQHLGNYSSALKLMLDYVEVEDLLYPHQIYDAYEKALYGDRPTVLVEHADLYKLET